MTQHLSCNINSGNTTLENTFCFPKSVHQLWDSTPVDSAIKFGFKEYNDIEIICLERCLRLAHRHATQTNQCQTYSGFLLGTSEVNADERGVILNLDRFDPGVVRSNGSKSPSALLPNDVVIPIDITKCLPQSNDVIQVFSTENYRSAFMLLQHQVTDSSSAEGESSGNRVEIQLNWVMLSIKNTMSAAAIKPVPIAPTALAKNLAGPLNLSHIQSSYKTGFVTMNQTRKLLLMLQSDPKVRTLPTVGIWISGVMSVHSPLVWRVCMQYINSTAVKERISSANGEFLLVLYSLLTPAPMFFQCKCTDGNKPVFDLLVSQDVCELFLNMSEEENSKNFRLKFFDPTSCSLTRDYEAFHEVNESFVTSQKDDNKENVTALTTPAQQRGRAHDKSSSRPQSILKSSSRSSERSRGNPGVSFSPSITSDVSNTHTDASPKPLPSPLPSTIMHTPVAIKPSVPELSILFDDNFTTPQCKTPQNSTEIHSNSFTQRPTRNPRNRRNHIQNDNVRQDQLHQEKINTKKTNKTIRLANHAKINHNIHQRSRSLPQKMTIPHPQYIPQPNYMHYQYPHYQTQSFTPDSVLLPPHPPMHMPPMYASNGYAPPTYPCYHPYSNKPRPQSVQTAEISADLQSTVPPQLENKPANDETEKDSGFLESSDANEAAESAISNALEAIENTKSEKVIDAPEVNVTKEATTQENEETKPAWVKDLPPEAYNLLMEQNAQLRQLQEQISRLLAMQETKQDHTIPLSVTMDASVSSINTTVSRDSGTDCQSVDINDAASVKSHTGLLFPSKPNTNDENVITSTPAPIVHELMNSQRTTESESTDKNLNTASLRLNSSTLDKIATANSLTDDGKSFTSSLKAVDLPALDTSTEQSTCDTPNRAKPEWTEESPVLGESASMCRPATSKSDNEKFYGNLLSEVCEMLKKADIDGESSQVSHKNKKKKAESVAAATKRQLRKMGINIDQMEGCVGNEYTYSIPKPLIPKAECSLLESKVITGAASTELSMHANAIAMRYLPEAEIAKSADKNSMNRDSISKLFKNDQPNVSQVLPGMSLVSPCNMSLATRKYMEKYGLIEKEGSSSSSESDEDKVVMTTQNKQLQNNQYHDADDDNERFLNLDDNLGETVNMLQPFLDDLGRHRQQTPTSGRGSSRSSQRTQSPRSQGGSYFTVEQVLSPRILQVLTHDRPNSRASSKQTTRSKGKSSSQTSEEHTQAEFDVLSPRLMKVVKGGGQLKPIPTLQEIEENEQESERLMNTWPRDSFRGKTFENFTPACTDNEACNVLTSRVTDAFKRKNNKLLSSHGRILEEIDDDNS